MLLAPVTPAPQSAAFGLRTSPFGFLSSFVIRHSSFLLLVFPTFASTNPLVWPAPPDPARVAFVESITAPRDAGARLPALRRMANWITGDRAGNEAFLKPFGLALDEQDNLCLTDTGANSVSFFDRKEKKWHRWSAVDKLRFASPVSVAKRGDTLYVADSALGAVIVFDVKGRLRQVITNELERPVAVVAHQDRLYVADSARHCVLVFDAAGGALATLGRRGAGPGEFNYPSHLAARHDRLYVTDSMNSRIQVLDLDGGFVTQIGRAGRGAGQFSRPKGVAVDAAGRVWVMDGMADNLQGFDEQGRLLLVIGLQGTGPGEFWLPNGIAISPGGAIYLADSYNRRLQRFQLLTPP